MKSALISALLIAAGLSAAPVFAAAVNDNGSLSQPLSRAQVKAELAQTIAAGNLQTGDVDYPQQAVPSRSIKTRAEVKAELSQAVAAGQLPVGNYDYPATPVASARHISNYAAARSIDRSSEGASTYGTSSAGQPPSPVSSVYTGF